MTRHFDTYAALSSALDLDASAPGAFRFLTAFGPATFRCAQCGETRELNTGGNGCGTGYAREGRGPDARFICYPCATENERRDLIEQGRGVLYLVATDEPAKCQGVGAKVWTLQNWTGGLKIRTYGAPRVGSHNLAGRRYDVWFRFEGAEWHGVQYGDHTQICRVRRLKPVARKAA